MLFSLQFQLRSFHFSTCSSNVTTRNCSVWFFLWILLQCFLFLSFLRVGAWSWCWWNCINSFLSPVQVVHIKTYQKTAQWVDNTCRLTLYQSTGLHVHQVGMVHSLRNVFCLTQYTYRQLDNFPHFEGLWYWLLDKQLI